MINQFRDKFGPLKQITVEIGGEAVFNVDKRLERPANWSGKLRAIR